MSVGVRTCFVIGANIVVTNSAALVTTGLTSPIAASQTQKLRFWIPFTVGATGGVRAQLVVPAGGTIFELSALIVNTVAPAITAVEQQASAAITNALANAGDHWLEIDALIINGLTAGNVDLQMAQNTADALSLTIKRGGWVDVVTL